jgi:hypothetical protein
MKYSILASLAFALKCTVSLSGITVGQFQVEAQFQYETLTEFQNEDEYYVHVFPDVKEDAHLVQIKIWEQVPASGSKNATEVGHVVKPNLVANAGKLRTKDFSFKLYDKTPVDGTVDMFCSAE